MFIKALRFEYNEIAPKQLNIRTIYPKTIFAARERWWTILKKYKCLIQVSLRLVA